MNIETIVKILELINKNKNSYAYIKNHFITYNLGTNNAQIGTWDGIIPKNWIVLENNYCSEDRGIAINPTFEKIFRIQ